MATFLLASLMMSTDMKQAVIFDDWQNDLSLAIELASFAGEDAAVLRPDDADNEFVPLVIVYDDETASDDFLVWLRDEIRDGNARPLHFVTRG